MKHPGGLGRATASMLAAFAGVGLAAWVTQHTVTATEQRCAATDPHNQTLFPAAKYRHWEVGFDARQFGWECRYLEGDEVAEVLYLGWEW